MIVSEFILYYFVEMGVFKSVSNSGITISLAQLHLTNVINVKLK